MTDDISNSITRFPFPSLREQAELVEKHGVETLLFCPDPWALCHVFIDQETGETVRARCNRWDCLYCGPRKVDQWRQLVKAAEPTLFLTLTKAGKTVEEAARALTTFLQYLRRGSKGRGPNRIGAREAYSIEYFAVLERHQDFEENGFHWHLLIKGADFIPHEVLKEAWRSARHGVAYIVHVEAVSKPQVIGYVTKYLMKSLSRSEKGLCQEERETTVIGLDGEGQIVEERQTYTVELVSKARRIRYSRHFFPEKVTELRTRLFAELEQESMEQAEQQPVDGTQPDNGKPVNDSAVEGGQGEESKTDEPGKRTIKRSSWSLIQCEEFTQDYKEYRRRRRKALLEALIDIRMGQRNLSRRVINMWAYQRNELRWASWGMQLIGCEGIRVWKKS
jgi:hypothetical protein